MTPVGIMAYVADAWILGAYLSLARSGKGLRRFNWANAVGAVPIAATEVSVGAWQALIITAAFGVVRLQGLLRRH